MGVGADLPAKSPENYEIEGMMMTSSDHHPRVDHHLVRLVGLHLSNRHGHDLHEEEVVVIDAVDAVVVDAVVLEDSTMVAESCLLIAVVSQRRRLPLLPHRFLLLHQIPFAGWNYH